MGYLPWSLHPNLDRRRYPAFLTTARRRKWGRSVSIFARRIFYTVVARERDEKDSLSSSFRSAARNLHIREPHDLSIRGGQIDHACHRDALTIKFFSGYLIFPSCTECADGRWMLWAFIYHHLPLAPFRWNLFFVLALEYTKTFLLLTKY